MNGTWSYGKMALLVEAKIFSYKIIVILRHNVNFDVTIMTSWRHFFRSTLGWFYRQIISRKSRRNFFNLLPFQSYKQKSKSWGHFPSPPLPYKGKIWYRSITGNWLRIHSVFLFRWKKSVENWNWKNVSASKTAVCQNYIRSGSTWPS